MGYEQLNQVRVFFLFVVVVVVFNFRTHEQDDYRSARFRMTFFLELKKE